MSRRFHLAKVEAGVRGTRFAGAVQHFPSVGSTNSFALEAAQGGARGGVWVADEQTAGRGRGGHGWHSAAGEGLYVSALVVPGVPASRALWISLATALAVRRAVCEVSGCEVDIRWPNDLLMGGRKLGGILVESVLPAAAQISVMDAMRYAVMGVGLNVEHMSFPTELRGVATSLRLETGRTVVREDLLVALLRALDGELTALDEEYAGRCKGSGLLERMSAASTWVRGKRVMVGEVDGYTGVTAGLGDDGFLRVKADDGRERVVLSGGVRELQSLQEQGGGR